jgi:hypothetical protein
VIQIVEREVPRQITVKKVVEVPGYEWVHQIDDRLDPAGSLRYSYGGHPLPRQHKHVKVKRPIKRLAEVDHVEVYPWVHLLFCVT